MAMLFARAGIGGTRQANGKIKRGAPEVYPEYSVVHGVTRNTQGGRRARDLPFTSKVEMHGGNPPGSHFATTVKQILGVTQDTIVEGQQHFMAAVAGVTPIRIDEFVKTKYKVGTPFRLDPDDKDEPALGYCLDTARYDHCAGHWVVDVHLCHVYENDTLKTALYASKKETPPETKPQPPDVFATPIPPEQSGSLDYDKKVEALLVSFTSGARTAFAQMIKDINEKEMRGKDIEILSKIASDGAAKTFASEISDLSEHLQGEFEAAVNKLSMTTDDAVVKRAMAKANFSNTLRDFSEFSAEELQKFCTSELSLRQLEEREKAAASKPAAPEGTPEGAAAPAPFMPQDVAIAKELTPDEKEFCTNAERWAVGVREKGGMCGWLFSTVFNEISLSVQRQYLLRRKRRADGELKGPETVKTFKEALLRAMWQSGLRRGYGVEGADLLTFMKPTLQLNDVAFTDDWTGSTEEDESLNATLTAIIKKDPYPAWLEKLPVAVKNERPVATQVVAAKMAKKSLKASERSTKRQRRTVRSTKTVDAVSTDLSKGK